MRKPTGPVGRHLDARAALDYLESRMDAASRAQAEEHLGGPCEICHGLVRELGWLVERMRLDREPDVSPELLVRLFGVYKPPSAAVGATHATARLATLLFDSWTHPLPAGAHRAVGEMRRLRFALGSDVDKIVVVVADDGYQGPGRDVFEELLSVIKRGQAGWR